MSYTLKFNASKKLSSIFSTELSFGYIRLGNIEVKNGGYVKDNPNFAGSYPDWSVMRFKDYLRLNYYSTTLEGSVSVLAKTKVGVFLSCFFYDKATSKRKVYITDVAAEYAEIIWSKKLNPSGYNKAVFAPGIFIEQ